MTTIRCKVHFRHLILGALSLLSLLSLTWVFSIYMLIPGTTVLSSSDGEIIHYNHVFQLLPLRQYRYGFLWDKDRINNVQ